MRNLNRKLITHYANKSTTKAENLIYVLYRIYEFHGVEREEPMAWKNHALATGEAFALGMVDEPATAFEVEWTRSILRLSLDALFNEVQSVKENLRDSDHDLLWCV